MENEEDYDSSLDEICANIDKALAERANLVQFESLGRIAQFKFCSEVSKTLLNAGSLKDARLALKMDAMRNAGFLMSRKSYSCRLNGVSFILLMSRLRNGIDWKLAVGIGWENVISLEGLKYSSSTGSITLA